MAATKFNVVLDIPLTAKQKSAINKSIQAAVTQQIARLDNTGTIVGSRRLPPEWFGIWLKRFRNIEALRKTMDYKIAIKG